LFIIHRSAALGIYDQVNEPFRVSVQLQIISHSADFFNQILWFLTYDGSSIVKTLGQTSFHMLRMVIVEIEVSASVGWLSADICGQRRLFPRDQNIKKRQSKCLTLFPW
jgi:hypothetical protein